MQFIPMLQEVAQVNTFYTIGMFALIFVIFYFFIIRPQNKKQKETEKMIAGVKKGDKVVTIGGIHGVVTSTKETTVVVKVDDNCKIEFSRSAVGSVVVDKVEKSDKNDKTEKNDKEDDPKLTIVKSSNEEEKA